MGITNDKFELRAYSKKELAEKYQVSVKTFDKWLKPFSEKIGEKRGRFYCFKYRFFCFGLDILYQFLKN